MKNSYKFESSQLKGKRMFIFLIAFFTQIISLYFFAVIGRFDNPGEDDILSSYIALSGLASTICMCILVVYGTVIVNRFLVKNYVGEDEVRFYLYPLGRSKVFYTKIKAFCGTFFLFQFLGVFLSSTVFLLTETLFPILISPNPASMYLIQFFITSISAVILTISLIFISSILGIFLNSNVATIIEGVILVVIFGNTLAMAFASNVFVTLASSLTMALITSILIKITEINIEKDDVFSK